MADPTNPGKLSAALSWNLMGNQPIQTQPTMDGIPLVPLPAMPAQAAPVANSITDVRRDGVNQASMLARDRVTQATEAKRIALGGQQEMERAAVAYRNGNFEAQTPAARDLREGSYAELLMQYGSDVAEAMPQVREMDRQIQNDMDADRSIPRILGDSAAAAAEAVVGGVTGAAALGGSLLNNKLGNAMAQGGEAATEWVGGFRGEEQTRRNALYALGDAINADDNAKLKEQDLTKGDSAFKAGLKEIGRNFLDTGTSILANPDRAMDIVAGGIGSLATGSFMARGAMAAGLALGAKVSPTVANAVSMAALEGGDAFAQTANEVLGMSEDDLTKNSPKYLALREGMSHDDAQAILAAEAGRMAAMIQVPGAAAMGGAMAKLEVNPIKALRGAGLQRTAGALAAQGAEETAQEGLVALSSNIAIKTNADENRELTKGVGEGGAMGLVGGLGMTAAARSGSLMSPGAASKVASMADKALTRRAEKVTSPTDNPDTTATSNVAKIMTEAAPVTEQAVADVAAMEADTGGEVPANSRMDFAEAKETFTWMSAVDRDESEGILSSPAGKYLQGMPADGTASRMLMYQALLSVVENEKAPLEDRLLIAEELLSVADVHKDNLARGLDSFVEKAPEKYQPSLKASLGAMETFVNSKAMEAARKLVLDQAAQAPMQPLAPTVTAETATTQDREAAAQITRAAVLDPLSVSPEAAASVVKAGLYQRRRGGQEPANERQKNQRERNKEALERAQKLSAMGQAYNQRHEELGRKAGEKGAKTANLVRDEIRETGNSTNQAFSVRAYIGAVQQALHVGDAPRAKALLTAMRNFGESLNNKMDAMEQARASGNNTPVHYQAYSPTKGWIPSAKGMVFHQNNDGSAAFADMVQADASFVTDAYDLLLASVPDAGLQPLKKAVNQGKPAQTLKPAANQSTKPKHKIALGKDRLNFMERLGQLDDAQDRMEKADLSEAELGLAEMLGAKVGTRYVTFPENLMQYARENFPPEGKSFKSKDEVPAAPESVEEVAEEKPAETVAEEVLEEPAKEEDLPEIQKVFPDLIGGEANQFHKAYSLVPLEERPTHMQYESYKAFTGELFGGPVEDTLRKLAPDNRHVTAFDETETMELKKLLTSDMPKMLASISKRLRKGGLRDKGAQRRIAAALEGDTKVLGYAESRVLNLTMIGQDGELQYTPKALGAAALGTAHWLLNGSDPKTGDITDHTVMGLYGISDANLLTQEMRDFARSGVPFASAVKDLAKQIKSFMGIRDNADAPETATQGIVNALAVEVMTDLIANGVVQHNLNEPTEEMKANDVDRELPTVSFNTEYLSEVQETLRRHSDVLAKALIPVTEDRRFIGQGDVPPAAKTTQMRNRATELTPQQEKVINERQVEQHFVNPMLAGMVRVMGFDRVADALGYKETTGTKLNINHKKRQDGINLQLKMGWDKTMGHIEAVAAHAEDTGTDFDKVPSYFAMGSTVVGRLQKLGHNGQGDKMMRELVTPTVSTLDLSGETDNKHMQWFNATIAQAIGIKTELVTWDDINAGVNAFQIENEAVLEEVADFLEMVENGTVEDADAGYMATLMKGGFTMGGKQFELDNFKKWHAVQALGQLVLETRAHRPEKNLANFKHYLALEADGKTDGPINAMLHFFAGDVANSPWVENMERGGLYLSPNQDGTPKVLNDYFQGKADKDLYNATAKPTQEYTREQMAAVAKSNGYTKQAVEATSRLMTMLSSVKYTKDGLTLARNYMKNPLTILIYGSGEAGIAGNLLDEIMDKVYEGMSEVGPGNKYPTLDAWAKDHGYPSGSLSADLAFLADRPLAYSRDKGTWYLNSKKQAKHVVNFTRPEMFTLRGDQYSNVRETLKHLLVTPLTRAVDEQLGGMRDSMKTFQTGTQIMGAMAENLYTAMYAEKLKKAREEGRTGTQDTLSRKEVDQLLKEIEPYGAILEMENQTLNLGIKENATDGRYISARTLDGKMRVDLTSATPSKVGVKAAPFITISQGDGQMVLNIYDGEAKLQRTLEVFDGIEMPADAIEEYSKQINEAVLRGWLANPAADVLASYEAFLRQPIWEKIEEYGIHPGSLIQRDAETQELFTAYRGDLTQLDLEKATEVLKNQLARVRNNMTQVADAQTALKSALKQVALSVDHMASGQAPAVQRGIQLDTENIAEALQQLIDREHEKLGKAARLASPVEVAPQGGFQKLFGADTSKRIRKGLTFEATPREILERLSKNASTGDKEQMGLLSQVLRLVPREVTYTFGDSTALAGKLKDMGMNGVPDVTYGVYFPESKDILIANPTVETVLHESLHAMTFDALLDGTREDGKAENRAAVERLDGLMTGFLRMDVSTLSGPMLEAVQDARTEIGTLLDSTDPDAKVRALSEFISWGLANQNVSALLRETKAGSFITLAKKVVRLLQALLGRRVPNSVYDNLRFNAQILMTGNDKIDVRHWATNRPLYHRVATRPGLQDLEHGMLDRYSAWKANLTPQKIVDLQEAQKVSAYDVSAAIQAGFALDPDQTRVAAQVHAAISAGMELEPGMVSTLSDLHRRVMEGLTGPEIFLPDYNTSQDIAARMRADAMFRMLTGIDQTGKNREGRREQLALFMALGLTSGDMRDALNRIPPARKTRIEKITGEEGSLDQFLTSVVNRSLDAANQAVYGNFQDRRVTQVLDQLGNRFLTAQHQSWTALPGAFTNAVTDKVDTAETWTTDRIQGQVDKAYEALDKLVTGNRSKVLNGALKTLQAPLALLSKKHGKSFAEAITMWSNAEERPMFIRELISEVRGLTPTNKALGKMVNKVRYLVQQARQNYITEVPKTLAAQFKRKLKPKQWNQLYRALGKTGLAWSLSSMSTNRLTSVLGSEQARQREIADIWSRVETLHGNPYQTDIMKNKVSALVQYTMTGELTSTNLLRNAGLISRLAGENTMVKSSSQIEPLVNELLFLEALGMVDQKDRELAHSLMQEEGEAMHFMLSYMGHLKNQEMSKGFVTDRAKENYWWGYMPSQNLSQLRVTVAKASDAKEMAERGWKLERVVDSKGQKGMAFYVSTVGSPATFNQGALQTASETVSGADGQTGMSLTGKTSGGVFGVDAIVLANSLSSGQNDGYPVRDHLIPVYDRGQIVAWENSIPADLLARMPKDEHFGKMLGVLRGRQEEERMARQLNEEMVKILKTNWEEGKKDRRATEYVNLADAKDPIYRDAWNALPESAKDMIEKAFGKGTFMVRRDMVVDAVGYRSATVGDVFTGNSRWSPETQKRVKNLAISLFGKDAYTRLVKLERLWQSGVHSAKNVIVIRSGIVALGNLVSNMYHLLLAGVPVTSLGSMMSKSRETTQYMRNMDRLAAIEAEVEAYGSNPLRVNRLRIEAEALQEENRKMSIWPLIEAGEFNTIAENEMESAYAYEGGTLLDKVEQLVDKLPAGMRTAGKYAIVSKDTALYQFLNRSVQYGDFLAKSVLYDHLTKRGGNQEEVLDRISDEFVNYNRQPGRNRTYLESMGMTWFWNFKLRSMKSALGMIRNNPLRVLMWTISPPAVPLLGEVDSVLTDNFMGKLFFESITPSMGPGMIMSGITLNPWYNLMH